MSTVQSDLRRDRGGGQYLCRRRTGSDHRLQQHAAIAKTVVDEQDNLNATLMSAIGLANNGYDTFDPAQDDYIAAIQRLRAPLKVLGDYSPEYGCLLQAVTKPIRHFAPVIGGTKPGLFTSSNFMPGAPNYTYPESLPMVNAGGGPNCRGLPDLPSKQFGGSWYRTPFLVTDNAYIPYEPIHRIAGRRALDAAVPVQRCLRGTG